MPESSIPAAAVRPSGPVDSVATTRSGIARRPCRIARMSRSIGTHVVFRERNRVCSAGSGEASGQPRAWQRFPGELPATRNAAPKNRHLSESHLLFRPALCERADIRRCGTPIAHTAPAGENEAQKNPAPDPGTGFQGFRRRHRGRAVLRRNPPSSGRLLCRHPPGADAVITVVACSVGTSPAAAAAGEAVGQNARRPCWRQASAPRDSIISSIANQPSAGAGTGVLPSTTSGTEASHGPG